jgi:tetratricopeptide (TPR) repeat protein
VKALRVEQIAARLDDRFRLLTGGSRTALPRHQTLLALIEWSHNMLTWPERVLLRRLSVFAGGWTLDVAEAVCAGEGLESAELLDLLIQLVDKSLIALDDRSAQPRYGMLETIREYARARLAEAGELELLGQRHLHFFLDVAEQTRPLLHTDARPETLLRLEVEHDNLRAALEWACAHDIEIGRWLGGILERFWFFGDHLGEAYTWYRRLLDGSQRLGASRGLALATLGAGCVAFNLELMDEAQRDFERSVELWRQLADQEWLALSLGWLAYLLLQRGHAALAEDIYSSNEASFRAQSDHLNMVWVLSCWGTAKSLLNRDDPSGKALLDDALALARLHEDPFGFMMCYSCLGDWAVLHDDYATARDHFLEALRWRRKLGTRWILAAGLWQVASILRLQGDDSEARPMYQGALQLAGDLGDQRSQAHISQELGVVATHLGRMNQASILLESSLAAFRRWADPLGIARCILGFTDLRHAQGQAERAARLLGFLEGWLRANSIQLLHFDRANYERSLAAVRRQLSEPTFALSQEAGSKLTLEQAVSLALQSISPAATHP